MSKHQHIYNFYFKEGMRDHDREAMIAIQDYLMDSEEMLQHGIRIRCDCFGVLILEVPFSGRDKEASGMRSNVVQYCEQLREAVGTAQLAGLIP